MTDEQPNEDEKIGSVAEQLKGVKSGTDESTEGVASSEETSDTGTDPEGSSKTKQSEETASGREAPAFPFDDTDMHGFYVRDSTWEDLIGTKTTVGSTTAQFGVSDFTGREWQDAVVAVASRHGEEIAKEILEGRGVDSDLDQVADVFEHFENAPDVGPES